VAEVTACLQQLVKICSCHFVFLLFKLFTFFLILLVATLGKSAKAITCPESARW
jgi:hypothetical protein